MAALLLVEAAGVVVEPELGAGPAVQLDDERIVGVAAVLGGSGEGHVDVERRAVERRDPMLHVAGAEPDALGGLAGEAERPRPVRGGAGLGCDEAAEQRGRGQQRADQWTPRDGSHGGDFATGRARPFRPARTERDRIWL